MNEMRTLSHNNNLVVKGVTRLVIIMINGNKKPKPHAHV